MKSLEIFSGAGGLAKGLTEAGFEHAAFVEINKHACASLRENFDPTRVFCGDIEDFDLNAVSDVDIVAGGPPCQPFSLGGKHKAHDDSRDMFPSAINAIDRLMPKAFVFENVKGLLRSSFADYFQYILLRLTYPGFRIDPAIEWGEHLSQLRQVEKMAYAGVKYNVHFKLLNAADFGVPQTRERVVIVGVRSDLGLNWQFPAPTHSEDRLLWDMHVTGDYWARHRIAAGWMVTPCSDHQSLVDRLHERHGLFEPSTLPWQTVRDALSGVPSPETMHHIPDHSPRTGARSYPGHTGSEIDWPAKTIKAGAHGVPGGENMIRYPDGSVRYFTVFEAKRIQTFPDDFKVIGAWGEAMRQIGNAVPVKLATVLGQQLMQTIQMGARSASKASKTDPSPLLLMEQLA